MYVAVIELHVSTYSSTLLTKFKNPTNNFILRIHYEHLNEAGSILLVSYFTVVAL